MVIDILLLLIIAALALYAAYQRMVINLLGYVARAHGATQDDVDNVVSVGVAVERRQKQARKSIFDFIEHSPTGSGLTSKQAARIAEMYLPSK